ncbi:MAG: hypothetical protein E7233_10615 [Lachnospiraceae bacterium]|nr:hypothetical protein [Lachnospiraceae bacterium]
MQEDFHYYATYCAAFLAGYEHLECMDICYSAQFVDLCSETLLSSIGAPHAAATTQLIFEMADAGTDAGSIREITGVWASFHFLPRDLKADIKRGTKRYKDRYRLICGPNGELIADTVALAKGGSLQAAGIAMHVLADTWAHMYFAGTPSLVINNTNHYMYEILPDGSERQINFSIKSGGDDPETGKYKASLFHPSETSVMNLGHGRAGHLPDYSFMKYRYLPAWGGYEEIIKDNPADYYRAFCQMVYALKTLRDPESKFETDRYDTVSVGPLEEKIKTILNIRQLSASEEWKTLGEELSGETIEDFDIEKYRSEYMKAPADEKNGTFIGKFITAAFAQKKMITGKIAGSGNRLAGDRA